LTIAGFSLGAAIGAALARRMESRLHHLVLIGPAGLGELWQDATGDLPRDMNESERRTVTRNNLGRAMIADQSKIDALAIAVQSHLLRDKPRLRGLLISHSEILLSNLAALSSPDLVTIVWGEHDPYPVGGARAGAALLGARFPGVTIDICENAGHWTAYEAPSAINELLLSRVLANAPANERRAVS
jgi:pimeloyl-ACP methyl ester carboxylesterase